MTHVVLMGVAGCGKSSVLRQLHRRTGWPAAEGDLLHPEANVAKMAAGTPLTDADRWPWLEQILAWTTRQHEAGNSTLVTCSALRRSYRDRLRAAPGRTVFVHLTGSPELLAQRIGARTGHFMPPTLLPSQLAVLEPLTAEEDGITLDVTASAEELAETILNQLGLARAGS